MRRHAGLIVVAMMALAGCHSAARQTDPATITRIADAEIKSLDPQIASDLASQRIAAEQFEGLTRFSAAGKAEPGLASGWTQSADGLTWRFRLRPNLSFSDGVAITPDTFVRGLARLRAPATGAANRALFDPIAAMTRDADTVVVTLAYPFPALPELLAQPALAALPLHRAHWTRERPMVASGAYRLKDWVLNDHISLKRNPAWHDGAAPIAHVRWQPVSDSLSALRLFQGGAADTTSDFPSSRFSALRKVMPAAVHVAPYNGSYYYVFNTRKPPFNDVRVRRALVSAVDQNWIAGPLLGLGARPTQMLVPQSILPQPSRVLAPAIHVGDQAALARARAMLAALGYTPAHPLIFDIRYNSDTDHRRVAVALAAMWKPLGVEAHLFNSEAAMHFTALHRGDFQLARSGWIGDIAAPENYLANFRCNAGPTNYGGYCDPAFDHQLDRALHTANPKQREIEMNRAQFILMQGAPIIPLTEYVSKSLVSARVRGWQDNTANIHPSRTLRLQH